MIDDRGQIATVFLLRDLVNPDARGAAQEVVLRGLLGADALEDPPDTSATRSASTP